MRSFTYERATDAVAAARAVAQRPGAKFLAGGTNLLDLMKLEIETPTHLVDVQDLGFDKIEKTADGFRLTLPQTRVDCQSLVVASGGKLILVLPFAVDESKRTPDKEVVAVFGNVHAPEQRAVGVGLYKVLTEYLTSGDIKVRDSSFKLLNPNSSYACV